MRFEVDGAYVSGVQANGRWVCSGCQIVAPFPSLPIYSGLRVSNERFIKFPYEMAKCCDCITTMTEISSSHAVTCS